MIRLMIIDDHPLVAGGIAMMLKDEPGLLIAENVTTAAKALSYLSENTPDVILLDLNLPDMDGMRLCGEIRKTNSTSRIIALTSTNESSIIAQFLKFGGNGYLLKNMEREELLSAVSQVLKGKTYLSTAAGEKLLEQFTGVDAAIGAVPVLTRREKEVLTLLDKGLTGPQIAETLFISHYTVETHRKNLMQKLNVNNLQQLLRISREYRLLG